MFHKPQCISEGIIHPYDCTALTESVLNHKELWDGFDEYPTLPLFTLGSPVYRASSWEHYVSQRAKSSIFFAATTRRIERLVIERLQNLLGREAKKLEGSSPFGFHVFNRCHGLREPSYSIQRYHTDHDVLRMYPNVGIRANSIFSFVIPISIPESGAGLDWIGIDSAGQKHQLSYALANLYAWNGSVQHKFTDLQLKDDEARITYQGHGFIANDHVFYYYW